MKKNVLFLLWFAEAAFGWTDVSVPNTFTDSAIIYASDHNENDSALAAGINELEDTLDVFYVRFTDITGGDSTFTMLSVDTIRSNPDIDSISGLNVLRGNPDVDSLGGGTYWSTTTIMVSDSAFIDTLGANVVNIDGGAIDGTTIGATSRSTGEFSYIETTVNATIGGQLIVDTINSNIVTGSITTVGSITCDSINVSKMGGLNIMKGNPTVDSLQGGVAWATQQIFVSDSLFADTLTANILRTTQRTFLGNGATDSHTVTGALTIVEDGQGYLFGNRTEAMSIASQLSGYASRIYLFNKDGDGTDQASIRIYTQGTDVSTANSSYFEVMADSTTNAAAYLRTGITGTGKKMNLRIYPAGALGALDIDTNATVKVGDSLAVGGNATIAGDLAIAGAFTGRRLGNTDPVYTDSIVPGYSIVVMEGLNDYAMKLGGVDSGQTVMVCSRSGAGLYITNVSWGGSDSLQVNLFHSYLLGFNGTEWNVLFDFDGTAGQSW
jgi:hypothetical protein